MSLPPPPPSIPPLAPATPAPPYAGGPLQLAYAPQAKSRNRAAWVVVVGLLTTALALLGDYLLVSYADTDLMSRYANYVIPYGAILVGLVASSGYAITSWLTGVKIQKRLLLLILSLLVLAYFVAQYIEYAVHYQLLAAYFRRPISFVSYFHENAISFAWQGKDGKAGEPLGLWGYFFRLLEIVGFAGGGLIMPAALMAKPYCELCERYMKAKTLGVFPASLPAKKFSKKQADEGTRYAQQSQQVAEQASAALGRLRQAAQSNNAAAFREELATAQTAKATQKLPSRLEVAFVTCPNCASGYLNPAIVRGVGNKVVRNPLEKTDLSPMFVRDLEQPR